MESADDLCRIEGGSPGDDERETREQHAEMCARVVARADPAAVDAQRSDHAVEQRHDAETAEHQDERAVLQHGEPRQHTDVIARVEAQPGGIGDAEVRRRRREHGVPPPTGGAEREHSAEHDAKQHGEGEERPARHRFHDLEIAEPARHLHRADGSVDDEEIDGDPGYGDAQDDELEEAGEITDGDHRLATGERAVPGALGRLHGQPAAADQCSHQGPGADQVQRAPVGSRHTVTPRAASQPSTSAR